MFYGLVNAFSCLSILFVVLSPAYSVQVLQCCYTGVTWFFSDGYGCPYLMHLLEHCSSFSDPVFHIECQVSITGLVCVLPRSISTRSCLLTLFLFVGYVLLSVLITFVLILSPIFSAFVCSHVFILLHTVVSVQNWLKEGQPGNLCGVRQVVLKAQEQNQLGSF